MNRQAEMDMHAVYRIYPGENYKNRPPYYSKLLMFQSFLLAWRRVGGTLTLLVDAEAMPDPYLPLFERYATDVRYLGGLGNSGSYVEALQRIKEVPDEDLVYLAEDDYLYTGDTFVEWMAAARDIPQADYFTFYDHPDRYTRTDDAWRPRERVFVGGRRHWRTVESTCMTYGARAGRLKRDAGLHRALCYGNAPRDRMIWRAAQGVGRYFWKVPKRLLIGPMPSLITHAETQTLAPLIDWEEVAQRVADEARTL